MTAVPPSELQRWDDYFMVTGDEVQPFWRTYLATKPSNLLYILGAGFDARTPLGPNMIFSCEGEGCRHVHLIHTVDGDDPSLDPKVPAREANVERIKNLVDGKGELHEVTIEIWPSTGERKKRSGPRQAGRIYGNPELLEQYSDVILDINALPRLIYYPILTSLIDTLIALQDRGITVNLHVLVAEDAAYDGRIGPQALDELPEPVIGFSAPLVQEANESKPKVWLPVLGEGRERHIEIIHAKLAPNEIAPLVPWPSRELRRSDNLLTKYHSLLFDQLNVDPRNVFYAPEFNPFAVCRELKYAAKHYYDALESLEGSVTVISSLSSKLLSIGALLAAYALKRSGIPTAIMQLDGKGYNIEDTGADTTATLYSLWITGDCYE